MKNFQLSSKHLIIAVVFLLSGLSFAFKTGGAPREITICHRPPGNRGNIEVITISINALEAHLDHGDNLVSLSWEDFIAEHNALLEYLSTHPSATNTIIRAY